jgi:hypothetical protein
MQLRKDLVLCMTFKDHLATQLLDIIKGHPEWASFVIRLTALAESLVLSLLFPGANASIGLVGAFCCHALIGL